MSTIISPFSSIAFARLLGLLALILGSLTLTRAQDANQTSTDTAASSTQTALTKVVQIFFIEERAYEGLPYTMFHRDSGSVIGIDADHTTYVITTTRSDQRPKPTQSQTDNITSGLPTLKASRKYEHTWGNATGQPSTITQGPATFMFTGTRFGPDHTLINRCSLNGTVGAACNLTHVGSAWYTSNTNWNGTFSTYSYNWTSGDRFGFAPVTITQGAELLGGQATPTASGMPNGAGRRLLPGVVLGIGLALGVLGLVI